MNPFTLNELKSAVPLSQLFPQFDQVLMEELLRVGHIMEFKEGELLMRTGQYFKYSLLILEGTVKLYREGQEGEEFFLYYLEKGNACALSMICATKNEMSEIKATAITPVKALAIPLQHMDYLMKNFRNWYYFVLETYRSRFEELLQVIDQVAFHSMDEKLEFYLKRQFQAFNSDTLTITHQQIADDLNSSREVISRLLKKLETGKRITVSRFAIKNINL
ncbi:Crp/Fnr family transcriptional regulator [Rhodocytophaga rosea]|uniref:Crp/Fnr family transcriptional regulator n=1 Tax=Rhodocytophaga rosea TaxID=2704465 RepID=A0A6C0GT38_9BACT|nr:Crp/Fnr family transcriptional regulator [Rhodocytophaga rosea]QHT71319.1 Crp/Fnr family transcriptional regulator [Rhodocytophaga rosea]